MSMQCNACGFPGGMLEDHVRWCARQDAGRIWAYQLLRTLASNLAVAGALCEAFELGRCRQYDLELRPGRYNQREQSATAWRPGCGRHSLTPAEGEK